MSFFLKHFIGQAFVFIHENFVEALCRRSENYFGIGMDAVANSRIYTTVFFFR